MIERLFFPAKVRRIRGSWLAPQIETYISWLVNHRYSPAVIKHRVPLLVRFGEFAAERGAKAAGELPEQVDAFLDRWVRRVKGRSPVARERAAQEPRAAIEQMLRAAGLLGARRPEPPWPFRDGAPGFRRFLEEERGLSPETIRLYGHYLRTFEMYLAGTEIVSLSDLSPARLADFLLAQSRRVGPRSLAACAGVLRTFLRYTRREGVIVTDLARAVDAPIQYRLASVPRSISWNDVAVLLRAVDRSRPIGKRDYAMLLLLVTYGLRAREVSALTLDDLDWKNERLHVPRRKGGHSHVYPLIAIVGKALIDYLRAARPASIDRHVFLLSMAPFTPLTFHQVAHRASAFLRAIGIQVRRPGSHTLRHTCVQRLVDAGFSLKAIGDFVGHRLPESTQIYGKVALEALRAIALARGEGAL